MIITQPSFKRLIFINQNFEFVISKSIQEHLLPLKHVFCFIILYTQPLERNPSFLYFPFLG